MHGARKSNRTLHCTRCTFSTMIIIIIIMQIDRESEKVDAKSKSLEKRERGTFRKIEF